MGDIVKCLICNNKFYIKRGIANLLSTKNFSICDSCYEKYKINITYDVIPLTNHKLYIYSLFDKEYFFKSDPFIIEFSRLVNYVITQTDEDNILIYKNIHITEFKLNQFSDLSDLINNDLYIVCNYHYM